MEVFELSRRHEKMKRLREALAQEDAVIWYKGGAAGKEDKTNERAPQAMGGGWHAG